MKVFDAEEVKKCLEDVVGEDKEYALWLLEWAINKRSFDLEEYRKQIKAEAIEEYNKELKAYLRRFSVGSVSDTDFDYIAERIKNK